MPNHLHGILEIVNQTNNQEIQSSSFHDFSIYQVGVQNFEPLPDKWKNKREIKSNSIFNSLERKQNKYQHIIPKSIGSIVRGFEIGVTKWFRVNTEINVVWQRNFYDSILRTEKSIKIVSKYITNNPKNWRKDEYYNDK
jgi:putative transposase